MGMSVLLVKNRSDKDFEFMCDGQVYKMPAGKSVPLVSHVAMHGIRKSIITLNPMTGESVKALVLDGSLEADEEVEGRVPGSELISRDPLDGATKTIRFANSDLPKGRVMSPLEEE